MNQPSGQALPVTGVAYAALMLVAGLVLAFVGKTNPALFTTLPAFLWLLGVALVFDLAVNALASQGRIAPLGVNWRVGGFLAGGLLHIIAVWLLG